MGQDEVLKFLEQNYPLEFTISMLATHFYIKDDKKPSEFYTLEKTIKIAIFKLFISNKIERRVYGFSIFYKFKQQAI
jgi:hypothetical protein